jgi:hypothetical protein
MYTTFDWFLEAQKLNFASMMGFANMSGTLDLGLGTLCELALKLGIAIEDKFPAA